MAFAYRHKELIRYLMGSDLHRIVGIAAWLAQLPEPSGARILDVGGGPGHLGLWMKRCWPAIAVTVLDRLASAVTQDWTPSLRAAGIRFVDGDLPGNLGAIAGEQFDRVVLAYVLAQDEKGNPGLDLRPMFRRAMRAIAPFVAAGGNLIVVDHFDARNAKMADAIYTASVRAGFSPHGVRGWRDVAMPESPWQLRIRRDDASA